MRAGRVNLADTLRTPVTRRDSLRRQSELRADSAAVLVDTMLVTPPALRLRVGDSLSFLDGLQVQALDAGGGPVPHAVPRWHVPQSGIVRISGMYLVAVAPGEDALLVRPVRRGAAALAPSARPATRVPVVVVP